MQLKKSLRVSVLASAIASALLLSGCATHSDKLGFAENEGTKTYAEAYEPARNMLLQGQWDQVRAKLLENSSKEVKEELQGDDGEIRQTVRTEKLTNDEEMERLIKEQSELSLVERGLLTLNVGDFERALFYFDAAEEKLGLTESDDSAAGAASKYGKSGMAVLLGSEEMANYELRGYEKVMLLNYKALCYMLMGDRKAYNVTRRAIDLQQEEWEKFKTLLAENEKEQGDLKDEVDKQPNPKVQDRQVGNSKAAEYDRQIKQAKQMVTELQKLRNSSRISPEQRPVIDRQIQDTKNQIVQLEKMKTASVGASPDKMSISDVDDRSDEVKKKAGLVVSAYVNPFADYLNAMMMEIDGFDDPTMRQNAKIAYKKVVENNKDCLTAKSAVRNVERGLPRNQKLVQIILSDGFSPYQLEKTKVFPIPLDDRVINAVVNYANATPVPTETVGASIKVGNQTTKLSSLTKMESLVLRDEQDRMPMRATMFGLAILRSAASGAFLGNLGSAIAGSIQHPDTRSWLTLPNQVFVARVSVPKSQKSLKLQTINAEGQPLATTDVKLAKDGPTVVYAVSYDKNIQVYANAFSWVD